MREESSDGVEVGDEVYGEVAVDVFGGEIPDGFTVYDSGVVD